MLMLLAAVAKLQHGNVDYLRNYTSLLHIWGQELNSTLPDPGLQLCTDDFEGPSPHNVNLAAKGVIGYASYAVLLGYLGEADLAKQVQQEVLAFMQSWMQMANDGNHYRLQYNLPNTWSQKYNLLYQYVLDLAVFPDVSWGSSSDENKIFFLKKKC